MFCISSARFNMWADILRQGTGAENSTDDPITPEYGEWVYQQDPLTHEIVRVWVPYDKDNVVTPDDPDTTENETVYAAEKTRCLVRGIVTGGIRVTGTSENWGELYTNVDYVRMWFPASVVISKRDRITNIRDSRGSIIWKDEEVLPDASGKYRATVFEVLGVTPITDPFGRHIENQAFLEKAQVYSG